MTQVLLVGTDCSECSNRAVEYAKGWAKSAGLRLYVAHVIEWSPFTFNTPQELEQRHKRREDELERAQALVIDPIVEKLRAEGLDARGVIRHGHPAETLNELATELGATNIVIGRRGQSAIKAKLFGSATSTLVQIADHPVTVVP
jgi:nucleotide-binding universal stress UspA family protein